jgi:putative cell wall-binding protein
MGRHGIGGRRAGGRSAGLRAVAVALALVLGASLPAGHAGADDSPDPFDPYHSWGWQTTWGQWVDQRFPFLDDWTRMDYELGHFGTSNRPEPEGTDSPLWWWDPYPQPRVGEPYPLTVVARNWGYEPHVARFNIRLPAGTVPATGEEHRMRCVDPGPWDGHWYSGWSDRWRPLAGAACPSHPVPSGGGYDLGTYTVGSVPFVRGGVGQLSPFDHYGTSVAVIAWFVPSVPHTTTNQVIGPFLPEPGNHDPALSATLRVHAPRGTPSDVELFHPVFVGPAVDLGQYYGVEVTRLAGPSRVDTAVAIARALTGREAAFVATAGNFPDALAAGPLAGGPVLLTGSDQLAPAVREELVRRGTRQVYILGSTGAVSAAVEAELAEVVGVPPVRLAGTTRYDTAVAIADALLDEPPQTVYVATGEAFPDALAGGPAAARSGAPLLLVRPDSVPEAVQQYLARVRPGSIVVLGGERAVSAAVERELGTYVTERVVRIAGGDRFATAAAIARVAGFDGTQIVVATGMNFPDALAGTPLAIHQGAPIVLVGGEQIPRGTLEIVGQVQPGAMTILGGQAAVSGLVVEQLQFVVQHEVQQERWAAPPADDPWDDPWDD